MVIVNQLCITLDNYNKSFSTLFENLNSWQVEYEKLSNGEITQEEYDEWRYKYPQIEAERFKKILTAFVQKRKNPNKRKNTIENFVFSDGIF